MSNLVLLDSTDVTSNTSSISINNVFTTNHNFYKIVVTNVTADTSTNDINLRFINSGGIISDSNYDYAWLRMRTSGFNDVNATSQSSLTNAFGQINAGLGAGAVGYVINPNISSRTFFMGKAGGMSGTETRSFKYIGGLSSDTACTGFNIFPGSNNIATANIRTYAFKVN